MTPPRCVIVCNPGGKRWETYHRELLQFWESRQISPQIQVVPWAEIVPRDGNLDGLAEFDSPSIVRLESPGKDDAVTRFLLEAGARADPTEPRKVWQDLEIPLGLLVRPGLLYRGFRRVLQGLHDSFARRPHLRPTANPLAIAEMFDKSATCRKLLTAGVTVPDTFENPADFRDLLRGGDLHRLGWSAIYVKLNTGSSAMGIVTVYPVETSDWGITTLAEIDGQYFNTRRLRQVEGHGLLGCVDFLLEEGAIVQRGIPMAQIDGQNFDVRVVCVDAKPVATIFRLSPHPMTNLHLGGRRGDWPRCREKIPTRQWLDGLDLASEAAACFESRIAGVDLLFERVTYRPYILEVNAFGDFFPGWTDSAGRSVHSFEIAATAEREW